MNASRFRANTSVGLGGRTYKAMAAAPVVSRRRHSAGPVSAKATTSTDTPSTTTIDMQVGAYPGFIAS